MIPVDSGFKRLDVGRGKDVGDKQVSVSKNHRDKRVSLNCMRFDSK